jgi:hypothetical protein
VVPHRRRFNVGIVIGEISNPVVLDVDPKHGGDETLKRLEQRFGPLPPTRRAAVRASRRRDIRVGFGSFAERYFARGFASLAAYSGIEASGGTNAGRLATAGARWRAGGSAEFNHRVVDGPFVVAWSRSRRDPGALVHGIDRGAARSLMTPKSRRCCQQCGCIRPKTAPSLICRRIRAMLAAQLKTTEPAAEVVNSADEAPA